MPINPYSVPTELLPREKLQRDPKGYSLSDAELLAIVLNTGSTGCPVFELALRLLAAFPSLDEFVNSDWLSIKARISEWNAKNPSSPIKGVADAKLLRIAAAFQFVARAKARVPAADFWSADLRSANAISQVFRSILDASPEKEHFYVLPVDAKSHPLCAPLDISQGSVSKTPVHPREVFCEAVRYRAYAIIVAHNHPTGDPEPSKEDIAITERLIETGKLLGIHVLDHLVLGSPSATNEAGYVSIRHLGVLEF